MNLIEVKKDCSEFSGTRYKNRVEYRAQQKKDYENLKYTPKSRVRGWNDGRSFAPSPG